jgi:transposase InsO family protein
VLSRSLITPKGMLQKMSCQCASSIFFRATGALRTDNGSPFASAALGGLTRLSLMASVLIRAPRPAV